MESELSRLHATVSDIDIAMKAQEQRYTKALSTQKHRHATALENERAECSKEIQELYYEIDDLKSRVLAEEHRK
jgi:gas vesicle protein